MILAQAISEYGGASFAKAFAGIAMVAEKIGDQAGSVEPRTWSAVIVAAVVVWFLFLRRR